MVWRLSFVPRVNVDVDRALACYNEGHDDVSRTNEEAAINE